MSALLNRPRRRRRICNHRWCRVAIVLFTSAHFAGCGGVGTVTSNSSAGSEISQAMPSDLAVSAVTEGSSSAGSLSAAGAKAVGDAVTEGYADKRTALKALLSGDNACSFTLKPLLLTGHPPDCYGPTIDYTSHPDASGGANPNGQLPVGDTGFWNTLEGSEACAAAQMNYLVRRVATRVDNGINLFAALICAADKAGTALPAVGETVDLSTAATTHLSVTNLALSSATITRQIDSAAGDPVYRMNVAATLTVAQGATPATFILTHSPTATNNATYTGKLVTLLAHNSELLGRNCADGGLSNGTVTATTIVYAKSSATKLVYEANDAEFCGKTTNPLDSSNNILPSDSWSTSNTDGWANNWNYLLAEINPEAATGTLSYAWQAGANDQRTRVFQVTATDTTGTAYFGFGPAIATASGRGTITSFICNWAGPHGAISLADRSAAGVSKAQRQTLARTSATATFTPTESKITYAPTNSCSSSGGGFTYASTKGGMTNDNPTGTAVTSGLIDLSVVDFVMPTPPADIF